MKYLAYEFVNRDEFVACRQHAQPILYCSISTAVYVHSMTYWYDVYHIQGIVMSHDAGMGTLYFLWVGSPESREGPLCLNRTSICCLLTTWSLDVLECMPLKSLKDMIIMIKRLSPSSH